jgi:type I restriction enzyme M protein
MTKREKRQSTTKTETTAQRLSGLIKTCRDIMRKDKGMNGDGDRLPMLTWIMFLKFLDDVEQAQETKALLNRETYRPAIESPYRWRDWATNLSLTGDDFLAFINNEKCTLPNGNEGAGLFYRLRSLQSESGKDRKDVIATVFRGVTNRMINGYLLRDVVNKIDSIHFTSTEEIYTLSHLYESILKEMRDASGDAGEFYTPRPVVKFMVQMLNPSLGESILDPAAGTGGFLVEAFEHLRKQAENVEQRDTLQKSSIYGGEAKNLPYLLCQMNLLLHGLEYPNIDSGNSLRTQLRDIGDRDRVDIILTNPPFGGEEERGILNNFPVEMQTAETAMLFLQLIMQRLKRTRPGKRGGRAAVVVPNGTLFAEGIAARIKEQMTRDFNLHTIVRLPDGVFAPYTSIPANLLFFEHGKQTDSIWFYEIQPPVGRKGYSKTKPMQFEEFTDCMAWWDSRSENANAWKVDFRKLIDAKIAEVAPLRAIAEAAKQEVSELKGKINKLKKQGKPEIEISALQRKLVSKEREVRENTAKADSIYFSAFNLDNKNPTRRNEIEYVEPTAAIAYVLEKEQQIIKLIIEIKSLIESEKEVSK